MLSGFLITYLLLSEQRDSGRINVPFFYIRRILRIWPMYFLVVLIGFVLFPLVKKVMGEVSMESHSINWYLLFLSNFEMINKGFADSSLLNVLWSVSVEEQFYLIPIIQII